MPSIFDNVAVRRPESSSFDLSMDHKSSFKMGQLVPCYSSDCVPGDRFSIQPTSLFRFAPLIAPVMHRVNTRMDFFFVPNRILWAEWPEFITGNVDSEAPYLVIDNVTEGSIADYFGFPVGAYDTIVKVSPLVIAAYILIYDEYYRDQDLQTEKFVSLVPGNNEEDYLQWFSGDGSFPLRRAWMRDYFTSARPFAQKGDDVMVPIVSQDDIPVTLDTTLGGPGQFKNSAGVVVNGDLIQSGNNINASPDTAALEYDPQGSLVVDVQAAATDINTLRDAFALQAFLEADARGGNRYPESMKVHFDVNSSDARLARPELIGTVTSPMTISEVLSTNESTEVSLGQMGGHGISFGAGDTLNYFCEEHGWIIGIVNVQPVTAYQDGIERAHTRFDRLDYLWPMFANLGEQEIKNREIQARTGSGNGTFGYQRRYAEYASAFSRVSGVFRSTLNFWTLARIFEDSMGAPVLPVLNDEFIKCIPTDRIFADQDPANHEVWAQFIFNVNANRRLPQFGIPRLIG